jgi:molybdopterin synthase sulfur carrier subunit
MAVQVLIATPLQKITGGEAVVSLEATSINELLVAMEERFPGFCERVCDNNGRLRRFLNVYVNTEDIRFLDKQKTPLVDGDEVSFVPAVAGG